MARRKTKEIIREKADILAKYGHIFSFNEKSLSELEDFLLYSPTLFERIENLLQSVQLNYFQGIGKPEPLKGNLSGYWSRRITDEHRMIYLVRSEIVEIISCKGHYDNL